MTFVSFAVHYDEVNSFYATLFSKDSTPLKFTCLFAVLRKLE